MATLLIVIGLSMAVYLVWVAVVFRKAIASVQGLAGYRSAFSWHSIAGFALPSRYARGIAHGASEFLHANYDIFTQWNCDVISAVSAFPTPEVSLYVADADIIKEICSSRFRFPKPSEHYRVLTFFGENIVASEGEQWKKYRKISAPAFSDRNNELVWDETARIMTEFFDTVWTDQQTITADNFVDVALQIAMFVISSASFGRKLSWNPDAVVPARHKMSFQDALHTASSEIIIKLVCPPWVTRYHSTFWQSKVSRILLAFDELHKYLTEMIDERQTCPKDSESQPSGNDLLTNLLDADMSNDEATQQLTRSDLMGNMFVFQLAGHETSAHTLSFSMALLALYPDEQEKLLRHIESVVLDGRVPTYTEMPLFTYSLAVFYETLRLFPPVPAIPKYSAHDTVLTTTTIAGVRTTIPVPKGTTILLSTAGLHYNPRYWEDPETFQPSRFLGDWPREAFAPFGVGARACLGRKYAETEGVMALTMFVSRYKCAIKEEPQFAGETFEQRRTRVLGSKHVLTTTPLRVPLVFTRR